MLFMFKEKRENIMVLKGRVAEPKKTRLCKVAHPGTSAQRKEAKRLTSRLIWGYNRAVSAISCASLLSYEVGRCYENHGAKVGKDP
jgi:hypothetical protein